MSSYFDTAQALFTQRLKDGNVEAAAKVISTARQTYLHYLDFVHDHVLKQDRDRVAAIRRRVQDLPEGIGERDFATRSSRVIETLHDLAHEVGLASFKRVRTNRRFLDNPYQSGNQERDFIERAVFG